MYRKLCLLLILGLYSLAFYSFSFRKTNSDKFFLRFPYHIGKWKGKDVKLEEKVYDILGTKNIIYRRYQDQNGDTIWFLIVAGRNDISIFHPPEICYLGSDYKMTERGDVNINNIRINRVVFQQANIKEIVYYWFMVGDRIIGNYYQQQLLLLKDYLTFKNKTGYMFKISVVVVNNNEVEKEKILRDFFQNLIKRNNLMLTSEK